MRNTGHEGAWQQTSVVFALGRAPRNGMRLCDYQTWQLTIRTDLEIGCCDRRTAAHVR